jgi:CubicO group peptidase (beta-lactamase class C family)
MPRVLSTEGMRGIEAVVRSHLAQGFQTAAQVAVYRDGVLRVDVRLRADPSDGVAMMPPEARMLWFSATKPLTALCVLMLVERGAITLDTRIAEVWPAFAQGGKGACTVRHVLTHQGGFPVFPADFDWARIDDREAVTAATAAIEAAWAPGTAIGYHPVTYGFALGEVIRRLDGRMPRDFMREELFAPLGMDASLGVGADGDTSAVVPVVAASEATWDDPEGTERRTSALVERFNAAPTLRGQLPAANAVGTAEALARCYALLVGGGELDGVRLLRPETVRAATTVQVVTEADRTSGLPAAYGLGFLVGGYPPLDQPGGFGHFGQQSVVGWADPERGIAAAYVTNGLHEPAVVALRNAEIGAAIIAACEDEAG